MTKISVEAKSNRKSQSKGNARAGGAPANSVIARPRALLVHGLVPASIALITFIVFVPALQNGFVNWDDDSHLLENPHYRGLGWPQLRWMFTTCFHGSCMPLNWVTYGMDYLFWGMEPGGYHLTSLLIHCANAVLFYFLSLRLLSLGTGTSNASSKLPVLLAASFSALFFSLHPLQVEAVAWTLGREIAIAGFFFILTLISYLRAAESASSGWSRRKWMGAAWIFYALSLLGKEAALTLPFALLVLDVYPLRRLGGARGKWFGPQVRRVWWEKIPFLLLALVAGIRATLEKQAAGSIYTMTGYGLAPRIAQVLYSLAFYPWKTLVPIGLSPLYPIHPFLGFWNAPLLLSGVAVLLLTLLLFRARHRWPAGLATWLFYAILLLPVSGVVAFGPYRAADRFSYVPSLAWSVLAGAAVYYCWRLWLSGAVHVRTFYFTQFFGALFLLGLAALTWRQSQIWHNSETLWRHALSVEEESSFAHNNLGLVFAERGALDDAISEFRRAVEIDPAFVEAHTNLGNFLAQRGSRREAIDHLRLALQIEPGFVNAHNTLGNILADAGELDEAIEQFRKALQTNPALAMTHYNLARVLAQRGDSAEAMVHYERALEIEPGDADAHNNLGLLLLSRGSVERAMEEFRQALRADPNYAKAYFNLGKLYAQQNHLDEAVVNFRQALRIQPGTPEIHENLARSLERQGKKPEALQEYQEAIRLLKLRSERGGGG